MGLVLSGVVCCLGVCVCLGCGLRFGFDLLCACLMCVSVNSVGLFAAHFTLSYGCYVGFDLAYLVGCCLFFGLVGVCLLLYCLQIVCWLGFDLVCWFDLIVVANWYCILVVSGVLLWVCLVSLAVCELVFVVVFVILRLGYMFDGCFYFGFG